MVDNEALNGRIPTSRIDRVPCRCDHCGKKYVTSVMHDSTEACSWQCQQIIDQGIELT